MKKPTDLELFYWEKRTKKHLHRKKVKKDRWYKKAARAHKKANLSLKKSIRDLHYVREMTKSALSKEKHKQPNNRLEVKLPENFSIIDNPEETLSLLHSFAPVFNNGIEEVYISHEDVQFNDLGAELLLARIAKVAKDTEFINNHMIGFRGAYPPSDNACRLVRAVGVVKDLKVRGHQATEENDKIILFKRDSIHNENVNIGSQNQETRATEGIVNHLNRCLEDSDHQLTDEAESELARYVGEILTNAEEHSGDVNWKIVGYLDKNDEKRICEVVIYNFGKTIANTFTDLPSNDFAKKSVNSYVDMHKNEGLFTSHWTEEDLITLVALQGRISSKNEPDDNTRGHGTVDLIQFFQSISDEAQRPKDIESARMCILSGKTHIRFDNTYRMEKDQYGRDTIAFNHSNDLHLPPDRKYVKNLGMCSFPGTLIAIRFLLPESATEELS